PEAIAAALARAARGTDLVLTTGGVSAGEADLLPALIERLGRIGFWKVRMRPGMPVLFGELYGTPVFALPGNPVSVFATYLMLVEPAIDTLLGARTRREVVAARLLHAAEKRHDRLEFRRASLSVDAGGVMRADLHATLSSGALRSVVDSDGLAELAAEASRFEAGDVVRVHRFRRGA
ncbi:MAG TPA: molybdopterin-binding protein, partial [Candidatus Saccharimonadia bacterium]|nr:molybdopterin-binding protein [Candidatus Saccharimonadia bacterium]